MNDKNRVSRILRLVCWSLIALPLSGCGSDDVSGPYVSQGQSIWDKFDFQSGQKVAVTAMGQTQAGEYAVMDDGRVRVMVSGEVLTLKKADDGCLEVTAGDANEEKTAQQWELNPGDLGRFCPE
jgi:hypothetical protein